MSDDESKIVEGDEGPVVDDRAVVRRFILIFFGLLALVVVGIGLGLFFREGPVDYYAQPATREERLALIARAESEMAQLAGNDRETRVRRDVARVAIAIQVFAMANEGRLPRTLAEAGIEPDDIEPGMRYSYGGRYWRLFQESDRLLARGN